MDKEASKDMLEKVEQQGEGLDKTKYEEETVWGEEDRRVWVASAVIGMCVIGYMITKVAGNKIGR